MGLDQRYVWRCCLFILIRVCRHNLLLRTILREWLHWPSLTGKRLLNLLLLLVLRAERIHGRVVKAGANWLLLLLLFAHHGVLLLDRLGWFGGWLGLLFDVIAHEVIHCRLECLLVEGYLRHIPALSRQHQLSFLLCLSGTTCVGFTSSFFFELLDSVTISQRIQRVLTAAGRWWDIRNHSRLTVPSERVFEHLCELRASERGMLFLQV